MLTKYKVIAATALGGLITFSTFAIVEVFPDVSVPDDPDFCTANHKGDQDGCLADHEHNCVWCIAKAVKPACYNAEVAKQLPHSIFNCSSPSQLPELQSE